MLWIRFADGIEMRDDGYTIYQDYRFYILRNPSGVLRKFRTITEAKKFADGLIN